MKTNLKYEIGIRKEEFSQNLKNCKMPIIVLVVLWILDTLSTWRALVHGFTEKNYFLNMLVPDSNLILLNAISGTACMAFIVWVCFSMRAQALTVIWVFNVVYAVFIGANLAALTLYNAGRVVPF